MSGTDPGAAGETAVTSVRVSRPDSTTRRTR